MWVFSSLLLLISGTGSVVDIATGYGLDGPGFESRWGEILRNRPDRPWDPPSLLTLTAHTLLVPWSRKGRATWYNSTTPMFPTAYTEPQSLYKGAPYLPYYLLNNTKEHHQDNTFTSNASFPRKLCEVVKVTKIT
jgi:hypothetical protein